MQCTGLITSKILARISRFARSAFFGLLHNAWLPNSGVAELLFSGTRDGMSASEFHARCDERGRTLTLVYTEWGGSCSVFGGFADSSWASAETPVASQAYQYIPTTTFLFSVVGLCAPVQYLMPFTRHKQALYYHPECGPSFGTKDLRIRFGGKDSTCYVGDLDGEKGTFIDAVGLGPRNFIRTEGNHFRICDVEVFSVA